MCIASDMPGLNSLVVTVYIAALMYFTKEINKIMQNSLFYCI